MTSNQSNTGFANVDADSYRPLQFVDRDGVDEMENLSTETSSEEEHHGTDRRHNIVGLALLGLALVLVVLVVFKEALGGASTQQASTQQEKLLASQPAGPTFTNLISKQAPTFKAQAYMPDGSFQEIDTAKLVGNKYQVLYWYPLDFTFVCASELIGFSKMKDEFEKRNVELLGISVDSQFTHRAWCQTKKCDGGLENAVSHPLISDLTKEISRKYNVLLEDQGVASRAVVIIDQKGVVRSHMMNDLPLGRNVAEVLRVIDALQEHEKDGNVCPCNYRKGKATMKPTKEGVIEFLEKHIDEV